MTKLFSKVLLTAVTAAVILSACSKVPEQSKYIPKTAGVVLSVNSKQITTKLVTNGLTMDKMFSALQNKDTANPAMKAWKDAENSGVDLQNNFFVSVVFNNSQQSYVSVTGGLKDAGKFEEYLKKNVPNFSPKKKDDFQYFYQPEQESVVGWNKETVIYLVSVDADKIKKSGIPGGMPGSMPGGVDDEVDVDSAVATPVRYETTDAEGTWVAEVDRLFHLKKDETVGDVTAFNELLKQNADLSVYVNPEPMYEAQAQATMIPANLKKLLAGSYYTGAMNFEKGKVVIDGVSYVGKELGDIYKKYGKTEADLKLLEQYPSENITGFIVNGFDMRMFGDIVKATGLDGIANVSLRMYSGSSELSLDDILKAFNGQMAFVASDLSVNKVPSQYFEGDSVTKTDMKYVFAMKVGDKASFDKVMSAPFMAGFITKQGGNYTFALQGQPGMPAVSIDDKLIVVANDKPTLDAYLGGKGKAGGLDNSFLSKAKGNPMAAYINFEKIAASIPDNEIPANGKVIAGQVKGLLKDATALSHTFDGTKQQSEIILNFKNQDENSLVQLVNLGTSVAKYVEENK